MLTNSGRIRQGEKDKCFIFVHKGRGEQITNSLGEKEKKAFFTLEKQNINIKEPTVFQTVIIIIIILINFFIRIL